MKIKIGPKTISDTSPVFIIAEAGVNHNGSFKLAKKLIDVAAQAGADAVKFQTFNPDTLVTKTATQASYQTKNIGKTSQYAMLKSLMLPREWHRDLKKYAEKKRLVFLSTPFSLDDAVFLKKLGVHAIKIGSSDTDNLPYLTKIAKWNIPMVMSTGMSDLEEVRESVKAILRAGNNKLIILHCISNYPTKHEEVNLKAIATLQKEFGLITGLSEHTTGIEVPIAAVALGAKVIEKHFTLDKNSSGPDHAISLEPNELKQMVISIRNIEKAMGDGIKTPRPSEIKMSQIARKSIVATKNIKQGRLITANDISVKRPGGGLSPKYYLRIIGTKATKDITADTLLKLTDYE